MISRVCFTNDALMMITRETTPTEFFRFVLTARTSKLRMLFLEMKIMLFWTNMTRTKTNFFTSVYLIILLFDYLNNFLLTRVLIDLYIWVNYDIIWFLCMDNFVISYSVESCFWSLFNRNFCCPFWCFNDIGISKFQLFLEDLIFQLS